MGTLQTPFYLKHFPEDPAAFKSLMAIYTNLNNVAFIKAAYTKQSIIAALTQLQFKNASGEMAGFQVKERPRKEPINSIKKLVDLYQPYISFQEELDKMPSNW